MSSHPSPQQSGKPTTYLSHSVKVIRGREAGKIAELTNQGWELTAQHTGPLRTELTFRKPQPETLPAKILAAFQALAPATRRRVLIAAGVVAAAALVTGVVLVAVSGGEELDRTAATGRTEAADAEPTTEPTTPSQPPEASSPAPEATPTAEPVPEVITAKNTPAFAALLRGDDCSRDYKVFAKKYEGKVIEFDGSVADVAPHGNYETRFDYLLGAGDDGPNTTRGALLRYEDVNYYDFGLTGANQPDSLDVGDLFRFTATVDNYNPQTCLLALSPVKTQAR